MILPLVVIIGTAAVVSVGIYLTVHGFKVSEARANGIHDAAAEHPVHTRHDHATHELLRKFFEGKECAICKRAIPPVYRTGLKPGLWNPSTHATHAWDEIPNGNVSASVDGYLPLCSSCVVAESFRQRFPDRVTDRDRSLENAIH